MTLEEKLEKMKVESLSRQSEQGLESLQDSDVCGRCGGHGYVITAGNGQDVAVPCKCLLRDIDDRRLRFANLPPAFKGMQLKTFNIAVYRKSDSKKKINAACQVIKRFLDHFDEMQHAGMGLYLYSQEKGSGKTRMAASIVNELLERGKMAKFATSLSILNEIKGTWKGESQYSESRLLDQLILADILVIDDFGTEQIADWINDKFYYIVNERYIRKKVTIYTSNVSLEQLKYDDRITSRIKEVTYQIAFPEESVRDVIAAQNINKLLEAM